ncbi:hypothetical protein PsYK624_064990 [Phanerochaete sordida]|uniref:NTF2 domain-containing protein n=1 Tax=Phanerochaete sordida TaxID=48140 RepID=A0A9P3G8Q7_9APHY|nr:hypothetical protein PsYK624_064990 [Phanerochaete sordida]
MHKQQHAESQQRPTTPSPAASESSVKVAKSETSSRLSSPGRAISIDAEVDSSDELYVTWEEHRSMSTARQDSATTVDASKVEPAPKHVLLVEGNEPPRPLTPKFDTSTVEPLAEESPWTETEALNLQAEATEWLRNYICVFDTDRSGLASAYSQHAIFSLRQFSYLSSPPELPARPPPAHTGTVGILAALLDLPDSFAFNLRDAAPQISYDVVVLFDVFVYAQAHAPGVMLTCYVDPARCPSADEARGWRWVCEMQFVLRPNTWSEDDRAAGALWRLVAVSHQMTLRKIPLAMDWKWAS